MLSFHRNSLSLSRLRCRISSKFLISKEIAHESFCKFHLMQKFSSSGVCAHIRAQGRSKAAAAGKEKRRRSLLCAALTKFTLQLVLP
jgi:hypothetical protein